MQDRRALLVAASAYVLWGLFPLYFRALSESGAVEIVAYRAIWALVFCLIALLVTRTRGTFAVLLKDRRALLTLGLAGLLVAGNWGIYVFGVTTDRTLDASMGYFMNPLVSALLGVIVLGERLRVLQWVAFSLGGAAVLVLAFAYGSVPWLALSLALTFGTYGLVKKRVGVRVGALPGLTVETLAISVPALGYLVYLSAAGAATVQPLTPYGAFVALAGPVTAIPLLMFGWAAPRIKLSTNGTLQYTAPIMLFLLGWLAYGEPLPPERLAGFVLVWIAVAIFTVDALRSTRLPQLR